MKESKGKIACDNRTFGDPMYGTQKQCFCKHETPKDDESDVIKPKPTKPDGSNADGTSGGTSDGTNEGTNGESTTDQDGTSTNPDGSDKNADGSNSDQNDDTT